MGTAIFEGNGQTFSFRTSRYNPGLKDELKVMIPSACRSWVPRPSGRGGHWEISTQYLDEMKKLSKQYGFLVSESGRFDKPVEKKISIILDYMGLVRHRGGSIYNSTGWVNGGWNATFSMDVLQKWFGFNVIQPGEKPTLYSILSIGTGSSGAEVKKAYRRAARTWHPDVCKEPDAEEQFKRVQAAYEKLKNPRFRAAYDAGLHYEQDAGKAIAPVDATAINWKPPVRCGTLNIKAIVIPNEWYEDKYQVIEILSWDDIVDVMGKTMVTYWPPGGDTFKTKWVR